MSIIKIVTDSSAFYQWLQQSDSYKNNFTYEGANALQAYLDEMSDELDQDIEFDPIAWCVEYTEYSSALEAYHELDFDSDADPDDMDDESRLEVLRENTTVIEFDGGIIVADF